MGQRLVRGQGLLTGQRLVMDKELLNLGAVANWWLVTGLGLVICQGFILVVKCHR